MSDAVSAPCWITREMTPAQRRALRLLATPGAEARYPQRSMRWPVVAHGETIGTIHAESLFVLREAGFVDFYRGSNGFRGAMQRISVLGRHAAEALS